MQRIIKWNVLLNAMQVFTDLSLPAWLMPNCRPIDRLPPDPADACPPGHLLTTDACYWYPKPCHSTTYDSVACSQLSTQPKAILSAPTRLPFLKALPAYPSPNYFALTFIGVTSLALTMPAYSVHQRAPLFIITPSLTSQSTITYQQPWYNPCRVYISAY